MFSQRRDGVALRVATEGQDYESPRYGRVNMIDASAIQNAGLLHVFLTNRSVDESSEVSVEITGAAIESLDNAEILTGPGAAAVNTLEEPGTVRAQSFADVRISSGRATCELPPLSFAALTFRLA
jgi:alpha-N-arabinofuranosidase